MRIKGFRGGNAHRVHVILGFVRPLGTRSASEDVLFQRSQFSFVFNHAQIIPLKVMVGDMLPFHKNDECNTARIRLTNSPHYFDLGFA
jgi:hypothetical protein